MKKLTKKTILGLALIGFLIVPMFALTVTSASAKCFGVTGVVGDKGIDGTDQCDVSPAGATVYAGGKTTCGDWCPRPAATGNVSCDLSACKVVLDNCVDCGGWGYERAPTAVPTDIETAIMNVTNWILGFVAMIATLVIIYGGVLYLTAAGNEEMIEKAKKTISYGIIGVVICGLAYAIVIIVSTVILTA